jgi:hypothetical protein
VSKAVTEVLKCLAGLALVGNLGLLAWVFLAMNRPAPPREEEKPKAEGGRNQVVLKNPDQEQALGLEAEAAQRIAWRERTAVYGRVIVNPRAAYEVRAPFAGTVRPCEGACWPAPGEPLRRGQPLGRLLVRLGPAERLDLETKLADAQNNRDGARKVCKLRAEAEDRLKKGMGVPQRELDDARAAVIDAETQLARAEAAVKLWEGGLQELDSAKGSSWLRPLTVPADVPADAALEAAEVAAAPGSAVEAGALLLRVVDAARPLVRLDLPPEAAAFGPPAEVEIQSLSAPPDAPPLRARWVGPAAQVDAGSQLSGALYLVEGLTDPGSPPADAETAERLRALRRLWRPGLFVRAELPRPGEAQEAVAVPDGALLYHQGRALVYVRIEPKPKEKERRFERREVRVLGRQGDRWVVAARGLLDPEVVGVLPGEKVASSGAQSLLSLEFRRDADDD